MKQALKMKYWLCKVAIILFLGGFATELHAEDKFYIPNFGIAAGETKQLAIQFDSDNISSTDPAKLEYVAFQFDLQLPEGLTVAQKNGNYDFAYNTDRSDNHTFSSALQADGGIRVLSASLTNAKFSGTSGDFIYFSVTASDDFVGNQEIALKNIMFSTKSGRTNLENTTAEVSLLKRYKVTYMVDGAEYKTEEVVNGSPITLIAAPTKEGYTFSGWSEAPAIMPAEDITINGTFAVNSYKVTYMVDGAEYKTENVAYGSSITLVAAPTKEGHTFSGWSEAPATMPAKDITINGTFAVNSYKITYMVNGAEYQSATVAYGSPITLIAAPTKEGYTFGGWSEAPATMPAKDITISGTFAVNSYKVTYMVDGAEYKTENVAYGSKITLVAAPTKEGHTFSGWSEAPATMPAKDITINGTFAVNSYKVIYIVDGSAYKIENVVYGSSITLVAAPTKEGYTFSGWSEAPATMPAKYITINGTFAVNSYKVTYMVDGAEYKTENVAYGSKITLVAVPTKEGHTFSGWSEAPATMPAKDITINGTFAVNSYKVTYMVDGAAYKTENVVYGSSITLVAAPTKEGYTFSGWSEAPATMPAKDITISGTFAVNSYKVTYKVDGAEYKTVNVNFGEKIVLIDAPTKDGFTFSGWTDAPETMPAKDIVINGKFLINAYSVTYMVDGKEYRTIQVSYGAKIELIDTPTKEGYTFSGWSEAPATMPAKDITINGTFAVNSYKVTYMVDGAKYKTENVAYGSKITLVAAPTKEGHTFSGWTDAPESMPAKDITINGTFSINSYKITYMVDGAEYQSATVVYGSAITLVAAPTKEGYTFSGWSEAPATMPAKDITINGTFAVNSYKVTYMVDGAEYKTENVAYGSAITLVAAPTKEGYTFSGWSEAPATMPAEDITISGTFAVNYYTLTYIVDGEVYKEEQVAYGSEIVLLDAPIKDDYVFSGWSDSPVTMPAENVTITGSFVHTSISGVSSDATIKVDGNCVTVSGANNCSVAVYTVNGALVEKIDSYAGEEITLDKGIYVVRVGEKIIKIKL